MFNGFVNKIVKISKKNSFLTALHLKQLTIIQNQYATDAGPSDLLDGQISHDKITRFLNQKESTNDYNFRNYLQIFLKFSFSFLNLLTRKSISNVSLSISIYFESSKPPYSRGNTILPSLLRIKEFFFE